jgi:hypothetical protein
MDGISSAKLATPARDLRLPSGYGTAADHERSTEAGFRHHLIKPVSLEKLAAVLDEAIMEVHGR